MAFGLGINAMIASFGAIDALRRGDFATLAEGSAIAVGLGSACVDLALRHDTGSGLGQHLAQIYADHKPQPIVH